MSLTLLSTQMIRKKKAKEMAKSPEGLKNLSEGKAAAEAEAAKLKGKDMEVIRSRGLGKWSRESWKTWPGKFRPKLAEQLMH